MHEGVSVGAGLRLYLAVRVWMLVQDRDVDARVWVFVGAWLCVPGERGYKDHAEGMRVRLKCAG
jgi:hypothetical protein